MKDDRLRIPVDGEYAQVLGRAMICFASAETTALAWCEKLRPGYVRAASNGTSREIARDLLKMATAPDPLLASRRREAALEFQRAAHRRDQLLHSVPQCTFRGGTRLFRNGAQWTLIMIADFSDEVAAAEGELTHCLGDEQLFD